MSDQTATINTSGGTTTLSVGATTLDYGNKLAISIGTGFPNPASTQITRVRFYNVVSGAKGPTLLGTWNRTGTSDVPSGVTVGASGSGVTLTDSDTGTANDDYYYNVTATDSTTGTPYDADPELILHKQSGKPPTSGSAGPEANV